MNSEFEIRNIEENLPYDLLLLADESSVVIETYIHKCDVFGMYSNSILIGVMAIQKIDDNAIELKNMAISPKQQGKGFGSRALKWMELNFQKQGHHTVYLGTGDKSVQALLFYQKSGYEVHSIRKDFFRKIYPNPIIENGLELKHMIVLCKEI